jgi:hypothetical protein
MGRFIFCGSPYLLKFGIAMHSRLAVFSALLVGLMIGHSAAAQSGGGFSASSADRPSKIPVIFDTDFGPDYDDVGAIALLHAFADSGYIDILATGASCKHKNVAAALSVFNTYFNRPDLPIGIVKERRSISPIISTGPIRSSPGILTGSGQMMKHRMRLAFTVNNCRYKGIIASRSSRSAFSPIWPGFCSRGPIAFRRSAEWN